MNTQNKTQKTKRVFFVLHQGRAAGRPHGYRTGSLGSIVVRGADARGLQKTQAVDGPQGQPGERTVRTRQTDRGRIARAFVCMIS